MKIKLKVEPNWEIWIYESYSTVPIITNGTMLNEMSKEFDKIYLSDDSKELFVK